jgi:arabinofuranosyltransferase
MMRVNPHRYTPLLYLLPIGFLLLGSLLHYLRGYYFAGMPYSHALGSDDAYISYRYGWNLTNFHNLSWNESGYRRTEGFTNPLWVYLSAGWALLGHKEWIYPCMALTAVISSAFLLLGLARAVFVQNGNALPSVIGLVLAAATPAIWQHATSGLESLVFGLALALLGYLAIFHLHSPRLGVSLAVLAVLVGLLRSDGFVYLFILLVAAWIAGMGNWKPITLGLAISLIGLQTWRGLTFNTWLPNTAVAKVNFNLSERVFSGACYLIYSMISSSLGFFLLLMGLATRLVPARKVLAAWFVITGWLAYYVFTGGDIYIERHLVGLILFLAAASASLWIHTRRTGRVALVFSFLMLMVVSLRLDTGKYDYLRPKSNDIWVMLGQEISQNRAYYGVLLSPPAGKVPFYAGGDCLDTYGLNDPELARLQRTRFQPGHSAGSEAAAVQLARQHPSGVYSLLANLDPAIVPGPQAISLWVNARQPEQIVHHGVTQEEWEAVLATGDQYLWMVVVKPVHVRS